VLVRVRAAAVNPMDWQLRNGDSKLMTGRRFPRGIGNDFAGTVVAVGDGITRFKAGDEVLGAASLGTPGRSPRWSPRTRSRSSRSPQAFPAEILPADYAPERGNPRGLSTRPKP
jgi:NADPH:quinone reductase-like Zn-dependent oxidoreductase